ncbi:MAG TPA: LysR family transcriptional regulator [Polyangia bacterium]|nr:LysR family transcriptional regulator [Polyangia bacterium]
MDAALIPAFHDALVVARTGSVAEAARRLHKTPSAVSQQIRRIDERFGVSLFEKAGRGIRLSSAGEAVFGSLTRLFDEVDSLEAALREVTAPRVTSLRIAASDYVGEALLLPVLRRLFAEGAPLRFEITTANSIEASRLASEGHVDVAIISTERAVTASEIPLCAQRFFWIAPAAKGKRDLAAPLRTRLAREPLLRLGAGSQGRRVLDEHLGRLRLRPVSTIDVPSVSLILSYVQQGLGIGLVPGLALRADRRDHLVIDPADVPAIDVRLTCRPALKRTRPVARFLDELVVEARRAP